MFVAAGIFLSRLTGLIRSRVFSYYFGLNSIPADAFNAAVRIPNFLQNLFGEGVLSASFIPVYAGLISRGKGREADRVAGAIGAILSLVVSLLVVAGVLATPWLIALIAPGFSGEKRDLTITIVRILFPGTGLLVLSAWCLGILNSHRRFLLSYSSGVMWNAAMIGTLVVFGPDTTQARLAVLLAWGSVLGSALQFAVQLPVVLRVAPELRLVLDVSSDQVLTVIRNFVPVFFSRGVVQFSGYVDSLLASFLPTGALTGLANAYLLSMLPVSLFGMSVAAAELPEMSGEAQSVDAGGESGRHEAIRQRLDTGLRQIAFFVIPSAMAFLALGDVIAGVVFQSGRFTRADSVYVWGILAGSAVGLLASTLGRLYSSAYYALQDTRTPLRFALVRLGLTTLLGYAFAFPLRRWLGVPALWGAAGLTASAGIAGWIEMLLLRRGMNGRIGRTGLPVEYVTKLWGAAAAGAAVAWAVKLAVPAWLVTVPTWLHPLIVGGLVLPLYLGIYLGAAVLLRVPLAGRGKRSS